MVNEKEGKGPVKEVPCFGLRLRGVYPVLSDFTVCKSTLMCYYQSRRQTAFGKNVNVVHSHDGKSPHSR